MRKPTGTEITIGLYIIAVALAAWFGWTQRARAQLIGPHNDLYAFCYPTYSPSCTRWARPMLKDVCEETVREYGAKEAWCEKLSPAETVAYLGTLDPATRAKTIKAWEEGR